MGSMAFEKDGRRQVKGSEMFIDTQEALASDLYGDPDDLDPRLFSAEHPALSIPSPRLYRSCERISTPRKRRSLSWDAPSASVGCLQRKPLRRPTSISTTWGAHAGLMDAAINGAATITPEFVCSAGKFALDCVVSTPRAISQLLCGCTGVFPFTSTCLDQAGSPVPIHRSQSRLVSAGSFQDDKSTSPKLLIRLTVNESKHTLTTFCGHGKLKGLRMNIFTDVCEVLHRDADLVYIKGIVEVDAKQTRIEIIVEPQAFDWSVDVEQIGKRLTDQVALNHAKLMQHTPCADGTVASLISHFEIKGHVCPSSTQPARHWLSLLAAVVLLFASGSAAWSSGLASAPLNLRPTPPLSSSLLQTRSAPSLGKLPLDPALIFKARRKVTGPTMLEPLSTTIYGAAILSSMLSGQDNLKHARMPVKLVANPALTMRLLKRRDHRKEAAAASLQAAALGKTLGSLASGMARSGPRGTRAVMRATATVARQGANSAAERKLLEEEFPAESALIDDVSHDAAELLIDAADRAAQHLQLFQTKSHILDAALHQAVSLQAAVPLLSVIVLMAVAVLAPFLPLRLSAADSTSGQEDVASR